MCFLSSLRICIYMYAHVSRSAVLHTKAIAYMHGRLYSRYHVSASAYLVLGGETSLYACLCSGPGEREREIDRGVMMTQLS